jgi:hypothetical protein
MHPRIINVNTSTHHKIGHSSVRGSSMEILAFWLAFAVVAGVIASAKGRSGFGYFLLAVLLTPLIGIILAAALPKIEREPRYPGPGDVGGRVPCPRCAELIMPSAAMCRFCGHELEAPVPSAPQEPPTMRRPRQPAHGAARDLAELINRDRPPTPRN